MPIAARLLALILSLMGAGRMTAILLAIKVGVGSIGGSLGQSETPSKPGEAALLPAGNGTRIVHPCWDWIRIDASGQAGHVREQGFSMPARLPYSDDPHGCIKTLLDALKSKSIVCSLEE